MTDLHTLYLLLPEIILIAAATLIYMVGVFSAPRSTAAWLAIAALALAAWALVGQSSVVADSTAGNALQTSGPMVIDLFGYVFRCAILAVGLVLVLILSQARRGEQTAEEMASLLLMLAGLMLSAAANDLILLFVGLELVSIPTYVLLYIGRHDSKGQEAASKYFFLSILSSAVLLYGFSFLYGMGGSTNLTQVAKVLAGTWASPAGTAHAASSAAAAGSAAINSGTAAAGAAITAAQQNNFGPLLAPLALLLVFAGLAFRLTAVPFHFYAPDVYQGTSHANAGVLATLPKIAGLAVLARIAIASLPTAEMASLGWKIALVISVLTMTLGNMLALWQNNIRRMLAYSSIAHAGYLLVGVAVALAAQTAPASSASAAVKAFEGLGASMFYLGVYMFATLGAFAALVYLSSDGHRQIDTFDDLAGANRRNPVVAIVMAMFMFSLAGIPPLAGFWGKFSLLFSALTLDETGRAAGATPLRPWFIGLAVVTVLNAAIGAAYYLRVIGTMYFRAPNDASVRAQRGIGPTLAMLGCVAVVLGVGIFWGPCLRISNEAGHALQRSAVEQIAVHDSVPLSGQVAFKGH